MAVVHLMVGLPCSGKTTYAKRLANEESALLLTPDAWQGRLFGNRYDTHSDHDAIHDAIEGIMWGVAERVLSLGVSVILDFGFWAREERAMFRQRATALGVGFRVHYMEASMEEMLSRLRRRNEAADSETVIFDPACLEVWARLFEPPTLEELAAYEVQSDA